MNDEMIPTKEENLATALIKAQESLMSCALQAEIVIGALGDNGAKNLANAILQRI